MKKLAVFLVVCAYVTAFAVCGGAVTANDNVSDWLDALSGEQEVIKNSNVLKAITSINSEGKTVETVADYNYDSEGNDGNSEATAYVIDSKEDFAAFIVNVDTGSEPSGKYYKLSADLAINSTSDNFPVIGTPNYPFRGHFDGNAKVIQVNIDNSGASEGATGASVFGVVALSSGVAVKNLGVLGSIKGSYASGVVYMLDSGIIQNCIFDGTVTATQNAGGIVGLMSGGNVTYCETNTGSSLSATTYAGGIAAAMTDGRITNCTSNATLSGATYKGGIVGGASSTSGLSGNSWPSTYPQVGTTSTSGGSTGGSGGGGGGCNAGLGTVGLALCVAFILKMNKSKR